MYENLLKVIRHCGDANKSCADCPAEDCPGYGEWEFAIEALAMQAADAIEDLSKQLEQRKQKKEPYQRKRKKCCCGASRAYQYKKDGFYYLLCHGCGKQTPLVEKSELDNAWNEIADVPVVWEEV